MVSSRGDIQRFVIEPYVCVLAYACDTLWSGFSQPSRIAGG
jgi:hypothetical protein